MTISDFGGVEFALGSVVGHRAWKVTVEGILTGVSHTDDWLPGENLAVCHAAPSKEEVSAKTEDESYAEYAARVNLWRDAHSMGECKHGFYAYSDRPTTHSYFTSDPVLIGIVEGYGETFIGTKGFRSAKARILAVSVTAHLGLWALESFVVDRLRKNYPGVRFFESALAMHAEFPANTGTAVNA